MSFAVIAVRLFFFFFFFFNTTTLIRKQHLLQLLIQSSTFSFKFIEALLSWPWTSKMVDLLFLDFDRIDRRCIYELVMVERLCYVWTVPG